MNACTFFGHRDCSDSIKPKIRRAVRELIEHHGVKRFYVGNHGAFDRMAASVLREMVQIYPIDFCVVLAYLPKPGQQNLEDTILPEGIEEVPRRFAISWRNRWMLRQCQDVVSDVRGPVGGAAQFVALARKWGKTVIDLNM